MLRRKKKKESAPAEAGEAAVVESAPADAQTDASDAAEAAEAGEPVAAAVGSESSAAGAPDRAEEAGRGDAAIAFAETPAPPAVDDDPGPADLAPESAEAKQRRPRYQPAEVPLATPYGAEERLPVGFWVQSVQSVLTKSGTASPEEREREAAAEFQAAIMPGLQGLREAVPDAATPDDALRVLAEREAEHEYPEDSGAASLTERDIFQTDSSVYYRIRNRFEKPKRRVGWGDPWRPPPGLARPDPPRKALNRPE